MLALLVICISDDVLSLAWEALGPTEMAPKHARSLILMEHYCTIGSDQGSFKSVR